MGAAPERSPRDGLGWVLGAAIAFALFAPLPLLALPLAGLLAVSRPRTTAEIALGAFAAGVAAFWLAQGGELPDQVMRATALVATVIFVALARLTRATVTHRALAALAAAAWVVMLLFAAQGSSWAELRWWVAHRTGFAARAVIGQGWALVPRGPDGTPQGAGVTLLEQLDGTMDVMVRFMADHYPGTVALQVLAGFALATALCHRVARRPAGTPLGRLRDFRFSEHLGWAAAIPLAIILVPKLAAAKIAAGNVLLVTGSLYALRGVGVALFGIGLAGGAGCALHLALLFAMLFMLPVVAAGAILLGVLDAGLDFRRRWSAPPARH